jgi:GT2 family glycosyltransferase
MSAAESAQNSAGLVLISVATYKRPSQLRRLIESITTRDWTAEYEIVVVDNDPDLSGRVAVEGHNDRVTYLSEPRPGIAAARNRGLKHMEQRHTSIIFVDDDEVVTDGWLDELCSAAERLKANVVTGPVITVLPDDAPRWLRRGGFYQRARHATGAVLDFAATNNTLVASHVLRESGLQFDEAFSATGGSDTDFFDRLRSWSGPIVWCDAAEVWEDVPPERLKLRWIRRRAIRGGNVMARIEQRRASRMRIALSAVLKMVALVPAFVAKSLMRRRLSAREYTRFFFHLGRLGTLVGANVYEYARAGKSVQIPRDMSS